MTLTSHYTLAFISPLSHSQIRHEGSLLRRRHSFRHSFSNSKSGHKVQIDPSLFSLVMPCILDRAPRAPSTFRRSPNTALPKKRSQSTWCTPSVSSKLGRVFETQIILFNRNFRRAPCQKRAFNNPLLKLEPSNPKSNVAAKNAAPVQLRRTENTLSTSIHRKTRKKCTTGCEQKGLLEIPG